LNLAQSVLLQLLLLQKHQNQTVQLELLAHHVVRLKPQLLPSVLLKLLLQSKVQLQ
jgi:hypothetical protein